MYLNQKKKKKHYASKKISLISLILCFILDIKYSN